MIIYEQPLDERIRLFLRMENLFQRFDYYIDSPSQGNTQTALELLLELNELSSRVDVKSAILKIIDHQTTAIRTNEGASVMMDTSEQEVILKVLSEKTKELYSLRGQLGQHMKNNGFLNLIKQRMSVSGGVNGFDVPIFHHWMNQPAETRAESLQEWMEPYQKSREAIDIAMGLIRNSAELEDHIAADGFYQATLGGRHKVYQLLRVTLARSSSYYPEISAGKQRFSIRFVSAEMHEGRGKQVIEDIPFKLNMCGF
ncbi:MAG TPA: cell division protein ZapD [Thiothrix sp.]|nr:cell division protein ZapD [Thiothrix sp.]